MPLTGNAQFATRKIVSKLIEEYLHFLAFVFRDSPRLTDTGRGDFYAATTGTYSASNWSDV